MNTIFSYDHVDETPPLFTVSGREIATLIGYVRSERFDRYRQVALPAKKVPGVTGVILAGGASRRMGSNKALLLHTSGRIIEGIYRTLAELFEEVIIVTNTPQLYQFLPCRKVADIYPGKGVLSGIHSGLSHGSNSAAFVVACDMPQLQGELIRHLTTLAQGVDLVLPRTAGGLEPVRQGVPPRAGRAPAKRESTGALADADGAGAGGFRRRGGQLRCAVRLLRQHQYAGGLLPA